jgi:hypothetical protein
MQAKRVMISEISDFEYYKEKDEEKKKKLLKTNHNQGNRRWK